MSGSNVPTPELVDPPVDSGTLPGDSAIRKMASGGGVTAAGRVLGAALKSLTQFALARVLGAQSFGLYAMGMAVYQLAELVAGMGIYYAAVRFISVHRASGNNGRVKGIILQAISLPLLAGSFVGTVLFLGAEIVATTVFGRPELVLPLRIFAVTIPLGASMTACAWVTTGFQTATYLVGVVEVLLPLGNLILGALVGGLLFGLNGAVAGWVAATLIALVAALLSIRHVFPEVTASAVKPSYESGHFVKVSAALFAGDATWYAMIWTDVLLLGILRPPEEAGIYRAASQTAIMLTVFGTSFNMLFGPLIAELYHQRDMSQLQRLFRTVTRWSATLSIPLLLGIVIAGDHLLTLFGDEFRAGWLALLCLGAGQFVNAWTGSAGYILIMSGHQRAKLKGHLVWAVVNLTLNALLIPIWGLNGAALATGFSLAGYHLTVVAQVYHYFRVHLTARSYWKPTVATVAAAAAGLLARAAVGSGPALLALAAVGAAIATVYLIVLLLLRLEADDQMVVRAVQKRLGYDVEA